MFTDDILMFLLVELSLLVIILVSGRQVLFHSKNYYVIKGIGRETGLTVLLLCLFGSLLTVGSVIFVIHLLWYLEILL